VPPSGVFAGIEGETPETAGGSRRAPLLLRPGGVSTNPRPHTVVGVFHQTDAAYGALHELDSDGLPPQHVSLVAGDPELAGEVGSRSHPLAGAIAGFLLGVVLTVVYVVMGGPTFAQNVVGIVLGGAFVAFGLAFIGIVFGRALIVHPSHWRDYEHAVSDGGAVVTVECVGEECDHARHVLERAAADDIVEEDA